MAKWPKMVKYYLHSDKSTNYEMADELRLSEKAIDTFRGCCYEVELTLAVHEDGTAKIVKVGKSTLDVPVDC